MMGSLGICRILDANLDRAREGLRVIEDWCRFGLNDVELAAECKHKRQELAQWHTQDLRLARDTPGDQGTELSHPFEEKRTSVDNVLQANICRVQEALRVLEEYGKLYKPEMGSAFKQMRYEIYTLESKLLTNHHREKLAQSLLYLVTSPSPRLLETVEPALKGGLTLVQYREKTADDIIRITEAQKLCELCHSYGALFLVNDRPDIALAVNADGVHLGQQDLPIAVARQLLGPHKIIGRSTTNPEEMSKALSEGADYVGVGPVYATPTKVGKAAAGLDYVRYGVENCPIPWFAIGGIDGHNIDEVLAAGATRVAVVRAIMEAEEPISATKSLLRKL